MKYLEDRIKELELEFSIMKAKLKLQEFQTKDVSFVLNEHYPISNSENKETDFNNPCDLSEIKNDSLNSINVNLSSIYNDDLYNKNFNEKMYDFPSYPAIIGSWDNLDLASFDETDDIPPYTDDFEIGYLNPPEKKMEKDLGKIVFKFKVLHHEWEMDGYGYIIDTKEGKQLVTTNHGRPMFSNKDYLKNMIKLYKEVIQETEKASSLIE